MTRHILMSDPGTVLRAMLAGALADAAPYLRGGGMTLLLLVLAAAGTPIQDATCGAGDEDTIYVQEDECDGCECEQATHADRQGCRCVRLLTM
ncbi:MAG: hypothetical protein GQ567_05315 [Methanosarcinales archaeon]|nr:hypothetical protein [Methanosarcinales archaeon]